MTVTPGEPALLVSNVKITLDSGLPVVEEMSFSLAPAETLGIVGESGSGKTTAALACLGYARPGMKIVSGAITVSGRNMPLQDERAASRLRGVFVSHVPQDPATSLNPSLRIGSAIADVAQADKRTGQDPNVVLSALERVHLPRTREFARRFPHELSGGQQQRVLIAAALVREPRVVVLDEPTTGLDVVTQARVLAEIRRLHAEQGIAMVYISHDLAVVSQVADRIAVMYAGRIVEIGPASRVLTRPQHPYTRALIGSVPDHVTSRRLRGIPGVAVGLDDRPPGCPFAPRCPQRVAGCMTAMPSLVEYTDGAKVRCFEADHTPPLQAADRRIERTDVGEDILLHVEGLQAYHKGPHGPVVAAHDVSFTVARRECLALVGESGSGKTTIARVIVGLHPPADGKIYFDNVAIAARAKNRPRAMRRRCQIIFQNPYESLNPRRRVVDEVARPARVLLGVSADAARVEAHRLLELVGLPARLGSRFAGELSGGERQRVAIARALSAQPELLICDEITSALDVSVQATVIELLASLRENLGLSLLFITHNLGLVTAIADSVIVLDKGAICDRGSVTSVFTSPQSARTRELLDAAPRLHVTSPAAMAKALP